MNTVTFIPTISEMFNTSEMFNIYDIFNTTLSNMLYTTTNIFEIQNTYNIKYTTIIIILVHILLIDRIVKYIKSTNYIVQRLYKPTLYNLRIQCNNLFNKSTVIYDSDCYDSDCY